VGCRLIVVQQILRNGPTVTKKHLEVNSDGQTLTISVPRDRFGDFVKDLISNKRLFGRQFPHVFDIRKDNVRDIFEIIDHRVKEQSSATLVDFELTIIGSDGSMRTYTSIEHLIELNDMMSVLTESVRMSLSYLIRFGETEIPMKQDVIFFASSIFSYRRNSNNLFYRIEPSFSQLSIRIRSNSFTWAEDLSGHFGRYLDSKYTKPNLYTKLYRSIRDFVSILMLPVFFMFSFISVYIEYLQSDKHKLVESINSMIKSGRGLSDSEKIDLLLRNVALTEISPSLFWNVSMSAVATILLYLLFLSSVLFVKDSYVSLNEYSILSYGKKERSKRNILYGVVGALVISVVGGVFGNAIWNWF